MQNYEKHALRVSQVIAAVAKVSCKHGLWLVARVNKNPGDIISGAYDVRDRIRTTTFWSVARRSIQLSYTYISFTGFRLQQYVL